VTGETVPVTVTAPAGTPADQIPVPTVSTPVVSVSDSPPPTTSTQDTGSTPPASTQQSTPTAPTATKPQGGQQEQQSTQESQTPKPQGQGKTKTLVDDSIKKAKEQAAKDRTAQGVPTTHRVAEVVRRPHRLADQSGARRHVGVDVARATVAGRVDQHDFEALGEIVGEFAPATAVLGEAVDEGEAWASAVDLEVETGGHRGQT
jgi:hypothetical protein